MKIEVTIDGQIYHVEITRKNGKLLYKFDGDEIFFELKNGDKDHFTFVSDKERFPFYFVKRNGGHYLISIDNCTWEAGVVDRRSKILGKAGGGDERIMEVTAPMPGKVVRVEVKPGDKVEKNQVLIAIEAMKMENLIKSPREGIIEAILVKEGDSVEARAVLVKFKRG